MGKKAISMVIALVTISSTFLLGNVSYAEDSTADGSFPVATPGPVETPSTSQTSEPSVTVTPETDVQESPSPVVSDLPTPGLVDGSEDSETDPTSAGSLPQSGDLVTRSSLLDGELSVAGVTVWWSPESMYFPVGCSRFNFYYENYSGIRLLQIQMTITNATGNQITSKSEIGVNNGVTGTWSTQICGHELKDGPDIYDIELLIKDYNSYTLSDSDFLLFVGSSGTLENFVMNLFYDFVGRPATYEEIYDWSVNLRYNIWSRSSVTNVMSNSDAYIRSMVYNFYIDTLGREPDQAGYQYWIDSARNGRPIADIGSFFYGSDEYFYGYGRGNNADWIRDLYLKLMLRSADDGGLNYWVSQLESGRMNRTQVAMWFYQSPEKRGLRVDALYQNLLGRDSDPGGRAYWANRLTAEGDIALSNSLASSPEYYFKQFRLF